MRLGHSSERRVARFARGHNRRAVDFKHHLDLNLTMPTKTTTPGSLDLQCVRLTTAGSHTVG